MKILTKMFLSLLAFLSCDLYIIASNDIGEGKPARHQQHVTTDIADDNLKLNQASILFKKVSLDKDPASAKDLLNLKASNKCVADYLNKQDKAPYMLGKAIKLGEEIEAERLSIDKALETMSKSQDSKVTRASNWLKEALPSDRIKCCAVELLSFDHANPTQEIDKIIDILSDTNFGRQQVEKAKLKLISYSTIPKFQ